MKKWTKEIFDRVDELWEDNDYEDIAKVLKKEFKFDSTENAIRKAWKRYTDSPEILEKNERPKVLIFDIETAPLLGYIWRLWDQNVGLNMIHTDWYVLSWSAKWLGDPPDKVMYMDQRNAKNIEDDSKTLKGIWDLLNEADVVLTQNGISFDVKKLNARFIMNGFQPPSSYKHIDTKRIAKAKFGFISNKLEYMTDKLCTKYKKLKHAKFSGFELWKECLAGNPKAWNEMEEYNKYDVLSLEELYLKMAPWDNTINFGIYSDSEEEVCQCGSDKIKKAGFVFTKTAKYQRYKCGDCGHETSDRVNLVKKKGKNIRR
jgi:hypothetical protein